MAQIFSIIKSRPGLFLPGALALVTIATAFIPGNEFSPLQTVAGFLVLCGVGVAALRLERTLTYQAYHESETIARALLDSSGDAAILIDRHENILAVNDAGAQPLGYSKTELVGMNLGRIFDHHQFTEWSEKLSAAILVCQPQVFNTQRGDLFYENRVYPIANAQGEVVRLGLFSRDVSEHRRTFGELKTSEQRLRKAQEAAQIGSWELDIAKKKMWATERAFTIYGLDLTPDSSLFLGTVQSIVQSHDRERMNQALSDLIAYNTTYDVEYKINRYSDGEARTLHSVAEILRDNSGQAIQIIGTIQDVTERKLLEHQLIQAQKLEGIGTLAGGIAHDFNNLLAMVLNTAELLKRHISADPEQHRHLNRIIDTAQRGTSITKQLLLFSRKDDAVLEAISLTHIVNEIQEMMLHFLPKGIRVVVDIGVLNGIIMGDGGYIHQALTNLAINARDAMPDGGTLTFSEHTIDCNLLRNRFSGVEDGSYIALCVSDTGKGMTEEIKAKIFDPFFTTKERGKGTGLGLSIVHSIVKSHHGFMEVQSEPDKGTTFIMYFPALVQRLPEAAEPAAMPAARQELILLVDDEEIIREMLQEQLLDQGYAVMTATDGVEALDKYREYGASIQLVITDLGMPRMDGSTLFSKLLELNSAVKVIVSSGYLNNSSKSDMMERGIKDVLTKPYKFADIHNAIRRVLDAPVS